MREETTPETEERSTGQRSVEKMVWAKNIVKNEELGNIELGTNKQQIVDTL